MSELTIKDIQERLLNDYRALEAEYGSDAEKNVAEIMQLIDSAITEARLDELNNIKSEADSTRSDVTGEIISYVEIDVIDKRIAQLKNNTTKQEAL